MSLFGSFWKPASSGRWQVGDKIADHYEIQQILGGEGKSGMGIVYICRDIEYRRFYALKTIQVKKELLHLVENYKLFKREASLWAELGSHPYIVQAHYVAKLENQLFIVLEYIPPDTHGRNTLTHYLDSLVVSDVLKFSIQFCYGMEYAYSKGIDCHRDIKPDNIMITPDKAVKITDFGLAKAFQEIEISKDAISSTGRTGLSVFQTKGGKRACGTLQYMAPEQFEGYADKRSDVYSFGITLYQMIAGGKLPFVGKGKTQEEIQQDYKRLHKYENAPMVSSALYPIIRRCIEKLPQNRYQEFEELRRDLESLLKQGYNEVVKPPAGASEQPWWIKALNLDKLGEYDKALGLFDRNLEGEAPQGGEATHWRIGARFLFGFGRYTESIFCLEKALEFEPGDAQSLEIKALILQDLTLLKEALGIYSKLFESNPDNKLACFHKALCEDYLGKKEAANSYKQFIMLASDKDLMKLGYARKRIKELEEKVIPPREEDLEVWEFNNKGLALCELGRHQEAIVYFDKALKIEPECPELWWNKGAALKQLGRYKEAIYYFNKLLETNPGDKEAQLVIKLCLKELRR